MLRFLNLTHNQITTLDPVMTSALRGLQYLYLSQNLLGALSVHSFKGFADLRELDLSINKIESVEFLTNIMRPEILNLSNNSLSMEQKFYPTALTTIGKLILSRNSIERLTIQWEMIGYKYPPIKELYLDNNKLQSFSNLLYIPFMYNHLDVSFNRIKQVNYENITALNKVKILNISNNPWICNCGNDYRNLMEFLMQHDVISCSPSHCRSITDRVSSVSIDCSNQEERSLPQCLPYPQVSLDYSSNDLQSIRFTRQQENITSLKLPQKLGW